MESQLKTDWEAAPDAGDGQIRIRISLLSLHQSNKIEVAALTDSISIQSIS